MIPILLVSDVKGNVCSISYLTVAPVTGVLTVILVRSLCTNAKPILSVHLTNATYQEKA